MARTEETALREAAIKTAEAVVPRDIDDSLRAELVTSLASQLAIGVAQERMARPDAPPPQPTPLRAVK